MARKITLKDTQPFFDGILVPLSKEWTRTRIRRIRLAGDETELYMFVNEILFHLTKYHLSDQEVDDLIAYLEEYFLDT